MNKWVFICIFLVCSHAYAIWPFESKSGPTVVLTNVPPQKQPEPRVIVKKVDQSEILKQMRVIVTKLNDDLDAAQKATKEAQTQRDEAQKQVQDLSRNRDQWEAFGKSQAAQFQAAKLQVVGQKAAILRRDIIIGVMGGLIGIFLFLKLFMRIPFL